MNNRAAVHTVTCENRTRSFASAYCDVSVASGAVPTKKEGVQKMWTIVSVLSYAVRFARSRVQCYPCTA